jgi:hypothetical protein
MSVDYGMEIVYGFRLDREKFQKFVNEQEKLNPDFDVHEWCEEITEYSCCEFVYENHYCNMWDSDIYFGVVWYNRITAENLAQLERDRKEEVCDELVRIFGNYDMLDREQIAEPELHVVAQVY